MKQILCAVFVLVAVSAQAQTPTYTLAWDYPVVSSDVATYSSQVVTLDSTVLPGTPTCVSSGAASTTCSLVLPTLTTGTHTVKVAATRGGITRETVFAGIDPSRAPASAGTPRIMISVTVTVP